MSLSLYDASIPALARGLRNLDVILDKAIAFAAAKKIDESVMADARLIVDMFPLKRQVQIACDNAKGAAARLAGIEVPKHEDTETTLTDLKVRIAKTLAVVESASAEAIAAASGREIVITYPSLTLKFTAEDYITKFVLPNFYFHVAATYAILRMNGVDVGKGDFLGAIQ
jgi:hypothetical protein